MKTKFILLSLLALLVFSACKNEEESYREAMTSTDIDVLVDYLEDFPDAPAERIDSVQVRFDDLNSQHGYYSLVNDNNDIIESFQAAEEYIEMWPDGVFAKEVAQFIEKERDAYARCLREQYNMLYGNLVNNNMYEFVYSKDGEEFVFGAPNLNGEGYGCYGNRIGRSLDVELFSYSVNSDGTLRINKGKPVEFCYLKWYVAWCGSYYDGSGFSDKSKCITDEYSYWEVTDGTCIMKADVEFYDRMMTLFNKNGEIYYEKRMIDEEVYADCMKLIEVCAPFFEAYERK